MTAANCKRENKVTVLFGAVAALAAAGAVKNAAKIAVTPLDPLGIPKLPFRVVKTLGMGAVALAAGVVVASRLERREVKDAIRECMTPGRAQRPTGLD